MSGIFLGWVILNNGNIWAGFLDSLEGLVLVFSEPGNTRTIMFSALVGALILLVQRSGGVDGFINWVGNRLERKSGSGSIKLQLISWVISVLIFVETSISVLTVGTIFRPLFDRYRISREKLAYIIDSGSAPACILFPLNGWGAFIMGLLATQAVDRPFISLLSAIPYNFYALSALLAVPLIIRFNWNLKDMKKAEERTKSGEFLWPDSTPMITDEVLNIERKFGALPKASNMIIPIVVMIIAMPVILLYTGWYDLDASEGVLLNILHAMGQGSGSKAVLIAVTLAILTAISMYKIQGILGVRENIDWVLKGISALIPLALLMLMAFAIGNVCKELGTGIYVSHIIGSYLHPALVPALLFVTSGFIAFSTGTSWGTFAIMVGIAIPLIREIGVDFSLCLAAVLGGGVFGDHCSPISDTTMIASMSAATDHMDHVKTQLPYALILGGISTVVYLVFGFLGS
ncbi:Na+/H+ antiporter NhaC family protein [Membranihabitans maritimus]|uniref:Na+/H+ antiporter NhaC family protein n=1 Tax=Membranihabitans maritimus TaxID=2904244 RepID=UPI001F24F211|nr:Na+/H+ antiporter NhaC family protein [Membranihabitans maritimus]